MSSSSSSPPTSAREDVKTVRYLNVSLSYQSEVTSCEGTEVGVQTVAAANVKRLVPRCDCHLGSLLKGLTKQQEDIERKGEQKQSGVKESDT